MARIIRQGYTDILWISVWTRHGLSDPGRFSIIAYENPIAILLVSYAGENKHFQFSSPKNFAFKGIEAFYYALNSAF